MKIQRIIPLTALLLVASVGSAQNPETLTLEQAVRLALKNNPELRSARLEAEKANERVHEAWGNTMPSIDIVGQYGRALKKPVFFLPGIFVGRPQDDIIALEVGSTHSVTLSLTARQILFNGAVFVGVGAASIYSDAAQELYSARRLETVTRVRKAYSGVLLAAEAVALMRSTLKNAEDNLRNVQLMAKQGIVSEYDELRATVGVENIRPVVIQTENNYSLALDGLRGVMGIPPSDEMNVVGSLTFEPYDAGIIDNAERSVVEVNPTLRALRLQREVGEAFVNAERSNYLPTLAAFGNYQYQLAKNTMNFSGNDFFPSSTVGLSVSMNIFQGFQTNARVDQAKIEVLKTDAQIQSVQTGLRTGVHSLVGTLNQARKRIEAQQKTVEQAERGYQIVSKRFVTGSATQLDVNDAQNALTQAKVNRIQAIYDYLVASAELDLILGRMPAYVHDQE
ncbi:MAG: TolC family protein [Bacteroidota bacterium]